MINVLLHYYVNIDAYIKNMTTRYDRDFISIELQHAN